MFETKERSEQPEKHNDLIHSHKTYKIDPFSEIYYSRKINPLIKKTIERLYEISGLNLPMPKLKLYNVPGNYITAQLYELENRGYWLFTWDTKTAFENKDVIPHELYHETQEEYRKKGDGDSEARYTANASLRGQASINKVSALNGVNEAGAYIFGFGEAYRQEGLKGKELGIKVLQEIIKWSGTTIGSISNKVLDLFFTDKGIETESEIEIETARLGATLITAAIILWQNDFDVDEAAKHLLQDPAKTIDEILSMGRDKIIEILKSAEDISKA